MTPVERYGQLSVRGSALLDGTGERVVLRGISLFWSQWGAEFYDDMWIRWLANVWHVDVVRAPLGVSPDGYLDAPDRERAKVLRAIDAAIEHGLYVIVDWHSHDAETFAALAFFDDIAARYPACPNILYETWNEPGANEDWARDIKPHHAAIAKMLRKKGTENVVICGTGNFCRDVDIASCDPLDEANVCYSVHFYAGTHRAGLRDKISAAVSRGVCLFASEYGLAESSGDGVLDFEEMMRWWEFLERMGISHVNWSLSDKAEACSALIRTSGARRLFHRRRLSRSGKAVRNFIIRHWVP